MSRPGSIWQQYEGKASAELFRGCGLLLQPHPCDLEPPFDPFDHRVVTAWDCVFNDWEGPWNGGVLASGGPVVHRRGEPFILPAHPEDLDAENALERLVPIRVEQFAQDEATIAKAEQMLRAMPHLSGPVAFEILGTGPQPMYAGLPDGPEVVNARHDGTSPDGWAEPMIRLQFVAERADAAHLQRQLLAHYPNSAVVVGKRLAYASDLLPGLEMSRFDEGYGGTLCLGTGHLWPLRSFSRLDPDPLGVAIAAMEQLDKYDWALLQILFQPAWHDWAENAVKAVVNPYRPREFIFRDISERILRDKFATPLFAVSVRVLARRQGVYRHLLGWAEQFAQPPQRLAACSDENCGDLGWSAAARCTFRPGVLLNAEELASLIHLPGPTVASERLRRISSRTRPAVETPAKDGVVLGVNLHRGQRKIARIPQSLRSRHTYIAGASGTGKSTLLLNMICQDMAAGHGVGVLDPHGDLINAVLERIPPGRIDDVILFDPSDEEFPFALNILAAKDAGEQQRIVNETVMSFQKYFPASWGPRLERLLTYAIQGVFDAVRQPTLADVERLLVDDAYRQHLVGLMRQPRCRHFWEHERPRMPKDAADPVLNRLSVFLTDPIIRNIVCQRRLLVDFDEVLNGGKIFLANLSTGLLTERISGTIGSFLVTKIVNAAFRRARLPQQRRRPWYLYVDEFQAMMNLSVGFERILAEARKYNLILAGLANQYVSQLDPPVRQAIFGNVGTMIVFRLGVDDARLVSKEMGAFTAEEILDLELGECIVRVGSSKTAHNVTTYRESDPTPTDPSAVIVRLTRQRYARPRAVVEREIAQAADSPDASRTPPPPPTQKLTAPTGKHQSTLGDPQEDDLVK